MKQLKNRTMALILASVVTVVGAFGAENYKNSLMSLKLDSGASGVINLKLMTKFQDETPISQKKIDQNTYVILLPEVDGKNASTPELSGNVESVNIRTMPYTTNGKGYTKITLKTISPNSVLNTQKVLYIEDKTQNQASIPEKTDEAQKTPVSETSHSNTVSEPQTAQPAIEEEQKKNEHEQIQRKTDINESIKQFEPSRNNIEKLREANANMSENSSTEDNSEKVLFILGFLIVAVGCVYLYIRGRNKMIEVLGEKTEFSFDEEKPKDKKKETKTSQIRKKINELDKMYEKPFRMPAKEDETGDIHEIVNIKKEPELEIENNIVDLDELFQDKNNNVEDDTNEALDDFLSSFAEPEINEEAGSTNPEEEEDKVLNELFEEYIVNGNVKFSKNDVEKINELLSSEINDETLKNISKYAVSNPIKSQQNHKEVLEDLVTKYTIERNVSFSKEDIDALKKLMNVEIDKDFVTDLTTNPERTKAMQKEIEAKKVSHKNHEILTLNVKNMLPDLSEALKKQAGKRIEYEVKPQTVYYSEGYDVSKLSVDKEDLSNLVLDLDNPQYNQYRPSDKIEYVEEGYEVQTLSIKEDLPDLKDALKNPDKYVEKKEVIKLDEESISKSLSNVRFKPFYNGSERSDISSMFEDNNDIFNVISNDKENKEESVEAVSVPPVPPQADVSSKIPKKDEDTEKLMAVIEKNEKERSQKQEHSTKKETKKSDVQLKESDIEKCIFEGKEYEILCTSTLGEGSGCYLIQEDGNYSIIGFIGEEKFRLKSYEKLSSQKIQSRLNDKLEDGRMQYIIRIGAHKFIINVSEDKMEYVMDLC